MKFKKLLITIFITLALLLLIGALLLLKYFYSAEPLDVKEITTEKVPVETSLVQQNKNNTSSVEKSTPPINICDLYSESIYNMPLTSILTIAKQPPAIKDKIDSLINKAQGIYYLGQSKHDNSVFIILQNMQDEKYRYLRHNLQTNIVNPNGEVELQYIGYTGEEDEIDNAVLQKNEQEYWEFDDITTPLRPLKHTVFDNEGNIDFVEIWNYDEKEPIKYEMKDGENRLISVLKEIETENNGYKMEHVFYDKTGTTQLSISVTYEGPNMKRFIYYDLNHPERGIVIENKYTDGLLTEEKIYNSEYKLTNIIEATYQNWKREQIRLCDTNGIVLEIFEAQGN